MRLDGSPLSTAQAEAWLAWARAHHHADGCSCRGCLGARRALAREPRPRAIAVVAALPLSGQLPLFGRAPHALA